MSAFRPTLHGLFWRGDKRSQRLTVCALQESQPSQVPVPAGVCFPQLSYKHYLEVMQLSSPFVSEVARGRL